MTQVDTSTISQPEGFRRYLQPKYVIGGVIAAILIGLLVVVGFALLSNSFGGQIETLRDIFLILLALQSCVFGVVLILLVVMMIRLVNMLEFEIKPVLRKTNETVGMIRGTTEFMSSNVVKPSIRATSYVAGVRRGFKALVGNPQLPPGEQPFDTTRK